MTFLKYNVINRFGREVGVKEMEEKKVVRTKPVKKLSES